MLGTLWPLRCWNPERTRGRVGKGQGDFRKCLTQRDLGTQLQRNLFFSFLSLFFKCIFILRERQKETGVGTHIYSPLWKRGKRDRRRERERDTHTLAYLMKCHNSQDWARAEPGASSSILVTQRCGWEFLICTELSRRLMVTQVGDYRPDRRPLVLLLDPVNRDYGPASEGTGWDPGAELAWILLPLFFFLYSEILSISLFSVFDIVVLLISIGRLIFTSPQDFILFFSANEIREQMHSTVMEERVRCRTEGSWDRWSELALPHLPPSWRLFLIHSSGDVFP